jgi:hypothetical protein
MLGKSTLNKRTASLQAEEECFLGKISQTIYDDYVAEERVKEFNTEISFLIINFCFKSIPNYVFRKKFFFEFVPVDLSKGTVLCNTKEIINSIYFIKEGEVELKLEISLKDMRALTLLLMEKTDFQFKLQDPILKLLPSILLYSCRTIRFFY